MNSICKFTLSNFTHSSLLDIVIQVTLCGASLPFSRVTAAAYNRVWILFFSPEKNPGWNSKPFD